ncbi:MAG: HAD-IIA family hydrolase [Brevinematales bacterium]|nr:HAD-IIA family hydrolase [Brevinematales bacterium]
MIRAIISDMDGVLYRGKHLIPGAKDFVERLVQSGMPFLFLTNNSEQTPLDLQRKLEVLGISGVDEKHFITSAMATAEFLRAQKPGATVYVIGGGGLAAELYRVGFSINESQADYVVVGKTASFNFEMLKKAIRLIEKGAKFIGTNPDVIDPSEDGIEPACGSLLAAIEAATGKKPYIVGKPNPMMMLVAKRRLGCHASETLMIGDRMDTDILGGMEAGMKTALVLSGVSSRETLKDFPYQPDYVFEHVGEIEIEKLEG